jgi:hypothetical protein
LVAEAVIKEKLGSVKWRIPLVDNGQGNPDVVENDGVYSGTFIPPADGAYTITVHVRNEVPAPAQGTFQRPSGLPRLLPIDQTQLGCEDLGNGCKTNNTLSRVFATSADLPGTLVVVNHDQFKKVSPDHDR